MSYGSYCFKCKVPYKWFAQQQASPLYIVTVMLCPALETAGVKPKNLNQMSVGDEPFCSNITCYYNLIISSKITTVE